MNINGRKSPQSPKRRLSSRLGALGVGISLALAGGDAAALNGNITVIQCASCVATADFVNYAVQRAVANVRPGTYMVSSDVEARTAYVVVTGTIRQRRCSKYEPCDAVLADASGVAVDEAGVAAPEESVLEENDMKLFGTNRKAPIAPINVPAQYGGSYINNDSMAEDTNSAISNVLYIQRAISPNSSSVKIGTIVTVVWPDGTTAKFRRVTVVGSVQWEYVAGSARDKDGNKIDAQGNIIGNRNNGGTGEGSTSFGGVSGWGFNASGRDRCMTTTTMTFQGVVRWSYTSFLPC